MTELGRKLIKSLEEARAYVRGDCKHVWVVKGNTRTCKRCKIRVHELKPRKRPNAMQDL